MRSARVAIGVLGLVTVVSYGACYYAFGALINPIAEDTSWPEGALGATFGAVLLLTGTLGIMAGRLLDRRGARAVFALAATLGAGVLLVLTASTALMISGAHYWQMALSFVLFGLVFGAALPLRAVVMGEWVATPSSTR